MVSGSHEPTQVRSRSRTQENHSGWFSQFTLTYAADHTSKFTLSDQDLDGELFLYADRDRVMASDRKTDWVVLPFQHDGGTVYQ